MTGFKGKVDSDVTINLRSKFRGNNRGGLFALPACNCVAGRSEKWKSIADLFQV